MIRYVKHKDLDFEKYNACIENSLQSRIYAFSWYLDIVADDWNVFVLEDYEAVMPVPFMRAKRYFYFKKIIQPFFCQQLGVFSRGEISKEKYQGFINEVVLLKPKVYNFNSYNFELLIAKKFKIQVNYELALSKSYDELKSNYSKNLKRNLQKSIKNELMYVNISTQEIITFKKTTNKHKISDSYYRYMKNVMDEILNKDLGKSIGVFKNKELVGVAFFIQNKTRIIHLVSGVNEKGKLYGATPFLFDVFIKENSNQKMIFDFEGSSIKGIARFFKNFGAQERLYYSLNTYEF